MAVERLSKMESSDEGSYLQVLQWRLNACQKWSPLMTRATSKCICGVQPPEKRLMSHSQMLGKFEYGGGPIFKVLLEC